MAGSNESVFTFVLVDVDRLCKIICTASCDQHGYRLA